MSGKDCENAAPFAKKKAIRTRRLVFCYNTIGVIYMAKLTLDKYVVNGPDRYKVSELKRVYGSISYYGYEFVFLDFPETDPPKQSYRPKSYGEAILLEEPLCEGKAFVYDVTCTYDGHVVCVEELGLDRCGRPYMVDVE